MMPSFIQASYIVVFGERGGLRVSVRGLVIVPSSVWSLELSVGLMGSADGTRFIMRTIVEAGTAGIRVINVL